MVDILANGLVLMKTSEECMAGTDLFEALKQIAKDEFGVSVVRTDDSETSKAILDWLNAELNRLKTDNAKQYLGRI